MTNQPTKFKFEEIKDDSFTKTKIIQHDTSLLKKSIMKFTESNIKKYGIFMTPIVPLYKHKIEKQITCPQMIKENADDPTYCTYWTKLKWQNEYSLKNLNYMRNYQHFRNEFIRRGQLILLFVVSHFRAFG